MYLSLLRYGHCVSIEQGSEYVANAPVPMMSPTWNGKLSGSSLISFIIVAAMTQNQYQHSLIRFLVYDWNEDELTRIEVSL